MERLKFIEGLVLLRIPIWIFSHWYFSITEAQFIPNKQLQPKETQIYIKLVKYAMQALDIYQVRPSTD